MPFVLDDRNDKGREPKDRFRVTWELQVNELVEHERKLAEDRQRRIELVKQKYPHLKDMEIL